MVKEQITLFCIFILNGFLIGLLFDFFRILRKTFKTKDFLIYLEDILFWLIAGSSIIYLIFVFNNGSIRMYMLFAIIVGAIAYVKTFSKYVIKINVYILNKIKNIVYITIMNVLKPFKSIMYFLQKKYIKPIYFKIINIRKNIFLKIKYSKKKTKFEKQSKKITLKESIEKTFNINSKKIKN